MSPVVNLVAGNKYAVVWFSPLNDHSNLFRNRAKHGGSIYSPGEELNTIDGGSTWTTEPTGDSYFEVHG
jgi:hypothetical protein